MQVPGICNHDPTTVVLAHENGGGLALKHHDLRSAFLCSKCHSYYDGATDGHTSSRRYRDMFFMAAHMRTLQIFIDDGYIQIVKPTAQKISKYLPRNY
jgi:hypothetical protein